MSTSLAQLLQGKLLALSRPLSESDLRSLALVTSPSILLDALDLVDKGQVSQITVPNGRPLYQVAGTSGAYLVHPDLPPPPSAEANHNDNPADRPVPALGYCPCPAFSYSVFKADNQVICKHLLAVKIAQHLDTPLVRKEMGLRWIAAFATGFAPTPATATAGGAAGGAT